MLQFEEQKLRLTAAKDELDDLGEALGISAAKEKIASLRLSRRPKVLGRP